MIWDVNNVSSTVGLSSSLLIISADCYYYIIVPPPKNQPLCLRHLLPCFVRASDTPHHVMGTITPIAERQIADAPVSGFYFRAAAYFS